MTGCNPALSKHRDRIYETVNKGLDKNIPKHEIRVDRSTSQLRADMSQGRNPRHPSSTRDIILQAAEDVFTERGFSDSSISRIAKRAKVTKSLIHHHFGTKENLWMEVKMRRFDDYFAVQRQQLETAGASPDNLRQAILNLFNVLRDDPAVVRLIAWHLLDRTVMERHGDEKELTALGMARVAEAQRAGTIRPDLDPGYLLVSFFCLVFHWFLAKHEYLKWVGVDPTSPTADDEYLEAMLKIFFDGVRPR